MKRVLVIIFSLSLFCGRGAYAQDEPTMRGPAAERVEQLKKIRLMEALKLDEETSIRFFSRYNKQQEEMRQIFVKREGLMRELESLRKTNSSDAEYEKLFRDIKSIDEKIIETRTKHWNELRELLTSNQLADYVLFEWKFNRFLREAMRDMQRQRMERMFR